MNNRILQCVVIIPVLLFSASAFSATKQKEVSFKKDVTPILHDYCQSCHEPGGQGFEKTNLDMSSYEGLMKGTQYGPIIKPGDSFTSIFIQVIEGRVHSSIKMPYGMAGGLSKKNIGVLKKWVEQGALNN